MTSSRKLTNSEWALVRQIVNSSYPGQKIVKVVAEYRKLRPAEEGLDLREVGFALLIESGEIGLYQGVLAGQFICYIDIFYHVQASESASGWFLVVTIVEE